MINVSGASQTWYYYYADALGSIRLLSDAGGAIVESYTYLAFGQPTVMTNAGTDGNWLTEDGTTINTSAYGNPYLFTARRWDFYTQLYYYRFRDYSPLIGRFLQPDPAGYIDTMNLYAYVNNNPLKWIDPWGLLIVHYWPSGGQGSDKWHGHMSVELDNGTNISHWPSDNSNYPYLLPSGANKNEYIDDLRGEGGRPPIDIPIKGLNEQAIQDWWNNYNEPFSIWNNCTDVAKEALRQGGMSLPNAFINYPDNGVKDVLSNLPMATLVDIADNWMKGC
jgi:RHS repeat-associated protein